MLPTENLLDVFAWLKRVDISCAVLTSQLFRNIVAKNNSLLALHPIETLMLSKDAGDKWNLEIRYPSRVIDDISLIAKDDDGLYVEPEEEAQDEELKFDAFDECFRRFTLVLQICSVESCKGDGKASLSPAQWKSFVDATRSAKIARVDLFGISLQQLKADEFFELTRVPGLRKLKIQDCRLLSAFVDAIFIRACGECGITTLHVSPEPVDGTHYATDDQSLMDFCFKRRAGQSSPIELCVLLFRPTISADFVARFTQAYPWNPFRGRVHLDFAHYPQRGEQKPAVPELQVSVTKYHISFQRR